LAFLPQEKWHQCPLRKIGLQYAYIDESIAYSRPVHQSKYAMEYLRHKAVVNAECRLFSHLNLSASWRWQDRVGKGNEPYALLDARLSWDAPSWSCYVDCTNLLDKTYFDYSFIPQPGRWAKLGVMYRF
ncbi:MAG: TonB-dependent receptor, partial [Bacteroidales bacterium]|nr:TonB-dependent receptor [Candidatus Liminaster caballi]